MTTVSTAVPSSLGTQARVVSAGGTAFKPIKAWAVLGVVFLGIQAWVWSHFIASGPTRTPVGPTPVPAYMEVSVRIAEVAGAIAFLGFIFFFLVRPWRRERRVTVDGLFCLVFLTICWQDTFENIFQPWVTFNAAFRNLGTWDPFIPGWLSPNGSKYAAPLIFYPSYVWGIFGAVVLGNFVMRRAQGRWPHLSRLGLVMVAAVFYAGLELAVEPLALVLGLWSYPGAISWFTLFHGHYYQFPINEWILMIFLWTGWASLRYFRDDKGRLWSERGVDDLRVRGWRQTGVRYLALVGVCNVIFLGLYNIPNAIAGIYASPWPKDVTSRSYLTNGLCGPGTTYACFGPGIPIPRRDSVHVGPDGQLVR